MADLPGVPMPVVQFCERCRRRIRWPSGVAYGHGPAEIDEDICADCEDEVIAACIQHEATP